LLDLPRLKEGALHQQPTTPMKTSTCFNRRQGTAKQGLRESLGMTASSYRFGRPLKPLQKWLQ
jgi:hypothetical protein